MVDSLLFSMVGRQSVLPLCFSLLLIVWNVSSPAFAASAHSERPNIILITLDTTRADRMGFLGSKRELTPNLDAVASQSIVFERTYSHVPLTTASHATLLTGTYSQFNRVIDFGIPLSPRLPYTAGTPGCSRPRRPWPTRNRRARWSSFRWPRQV